MTHCHQTRGSLGPHSTSIKGCWIEAGFNTSVRNYVRISNSNLSCFQERAHDNIVRISISKVQGRASKPLLCVIYECNDCRNEVKALCTAGNHKHCPQVLLLSICIHDTLFPFITSMVMIITIISLLPSSSSSN